MKTLSLILILSLLVGCKSIKPYAAQYAGEASGRIQGKTAAVLANLDALKPEVTPAGKPLLDASRSITASIEPDVKAVQKHDRELQQNAEIWKGKYEAEYNKWYAKAGRAIQWIIAGVGFLWLAAGIAGIFLPVGGIGSTILRVLPFANPFAWVRDTFVSPGKVTKIPRAPGQ